MSDDKKPHDVISLLLGFSRRLFGEMRRDSGSPARTAVVRVAALVVVWACTGPILWRALISMPPALAVFIGLVIAGRIGLWFWRRSR